MILLDFVGDRELSTPREANSDEALWAKLRAAARRTGNGRLLPGLDRSARSATTTCPSSSRASRRST